MYCAGVLLVLHSCTHWHRYFCVIDLCVGSIVVQCM